VIRDVLTSFAHLVLHCGNTSDAIEGRMRSVLQSSLVFRVAGYQDEIISNDPASNRNRRGTMDELIEQLAAKTGIDPAVAGKTVGIMLEFLRKEGPADKVQSLIDTIPGAEGVIAASASSGGLSKLMGGGLMALGSRLMALGLGMSEIQNVARELFRFGRDRVGADRMGEIIAGTPGLRQFA
jgi:hypothetical protein